MKYCLFREGVASLLLSDVQFYESGEIKSGWVINGSWFYNRTDTEEQACRSYKMKEPGEIVTRFPKKSYDIVSYKGRVDYYNYQEVMQECQLAYDSGIFSIEKNEPKVEYPNNWDDDIAF